MTDCAHRKADELADDSCASQEKNTMRGDACVARTRARTSWASKAPIMGTAAAASTAPDRPIAKVSRATVAAVAGSGRVQLRMKAIRHSKQQLSRLRAVPPPISISLVNTAPSEIRAAASHLAEHGYCVCRGGLQQEIITKARQEARMLYERRAFTPGSFTVQGQTVAGTNSLHRDDHILWLHKHLGASGGDAAAAAVPTLAALDGALHRFGMRTIGELARLAEACPGGDGAHDDDARAATSTRFARFDDRHALHCTGRSDLMVSCYDGSAAAYGPHIDSVDGDGRAETPGDHGRCFTCIYYLNASWSEERGGGALRLFMPPPSDDADADTSRAPNEAVDVYPHADTLVLFRADRLVHEVRPTHDPRMAASIWFYGGSAEQRRKAVARGAVQEGI